MVVAKLPNNGSQSCARKARICAYDARTARSQQTIIIKRIQSCDIDASRRTDSQADRQALSPRESDLEINYLLDSMASRTRVRAADISTEI